MHCATEERKTMHCTHAIRFITKKLLFGRILNYERSQGNLLHNTYSPFDAFGSTWADDVRTKPTERERGRAP